MKLQELKQVRQEGRCPVTELKHEQELEAELEQQAVQADFTVEDMIELCLSKPVQTNDSPVSRIRQVIPGCSTASCCKPYRLAPLSGVLWLNLSFVPASLPWLAVLQRHVLHVSVLVSALGWLCADERLMASLLHPLY